ELSDREMGLGEAISRFDFQAELAELGSDVEGLLACGQRLTVLADVAKPRSHVGEDESQATPIAELSGDDLGLAHVLEDPVVLTQRGQDEPRVETKIDGLGLGLASLGETTESAQSGFQRAVSLGICGACR